MGDTEIIEIIHGARPKNWQRPKAYQTVMVFRATFLLLCIIFTFFYTQKLLLKLIFYKNKYTNLIEPK